MPQNNPEVEITLAEGAQEAWETGRPLPLPLFLFCFMFFAILDGLTFLLGLVSFGVGWVLGMFLTFLVIGIATFLFHALNYKTLWYRRILLWLFPSLAEMVFPPLPTITFWLVVYQAFAYLEQWKQKHQLDTNTDGALTP